MFKVLDDVCTPVRGTKYSAYVDLFAREDVAIGAGETKIVKLGVKIDLELLDELLYLNNLYPAEVYELNKLRSAYKYFEHFLKSHYLEIALRSSLGVKGLIIANGIGIIDLDYPDEIGLIVYNPLQISSQRYENLVSGGVRYLNDSYVGNSVFQIKKGDKVAQCTLKEHKGYLMGYETETLRTGGFGSTDKKEVHTSSTLDDLPDPFKCYKKI